MDAGDENVAVMEGLQGKISSIYGGIKMQLPSIADDSDDDSSSGVEEPIFSARPAWIGDGGDDEAGFAAEAPAFRVQDGPSFSLGGDERDAAGEDVDEEAHVVAQGLGGLSLSTFSMMEREVSTGDQGLKSLAAPTETVLTEQTVETVELTGESDAALVSVSTSQWAVDENEEGWEERVEERFFAAVDDGVTPPMRTPEKAARGLSLNIDQALGGIDLDGILDRLAADPDQGWTPEKAMSITYDNEKELADRVTATPDVPQEDAGAYMDLAKVLLNQVMERQQAREAAQPACTAEADVQARDGGEDAHEARRRKMAAEREERNRARAAEMQRIQQRRLGNRPGNADEPIFMDLRAGQAAAAAAAAPAAAPAAAASPADAEAATDRMRSGRSALTQPLDLQATSGWKGEQAVPDMTTERRDYERRLAAMVQREEQYVRRTGMLLDSDDDEADSDDSEDELAYAKRLEAARQLKLQRQAEFERKRAARQAPSSATSTGCGPDTPMGEEAGDAPSLTSFSGGTQTDLTRSTGTSTRTL